MGSYPKNNLYLFLIALLPLLSISMVSISIILFVFFSCVNFFKQSNNKIRFEFVKLALLYSVPFFLYVISLIWTEDLTAGFSFIEKTLSFIVLPFTIFILKPFKNEDQIKKFNIIYIVSCAILVLITLLFLFINIEVILSEKSTYFANIRIRNNIELVPIIGEHPIYFSMLIAVALLLLFYNKFKNNLMNILFLVIFTLGLIIASSRGVIIAILIVSIMLIFQNANNKKRAFTFTLLFVFSSGVLIYFSPIRTRIIEVIENKYSYPEGINFNSFNLRMAIYNCSFSIIKESPVVGYGPGDVQKELEDCYKKFNTDELLKNNYNTHNQYLDYFASFGPLGFIIVLCSFLLYLKIAYQNKVKLYFNFLVLFYISLLTENLLVRNTGIVLFTIFNCLMAFSIFHQKRLNFKNINE